MMKLFKTREEREIERIDKIIFNAHCELLKLTILRTKLEKRNNLRLVHGGLTDAKTL
jgi:hypothetical protein